TCVTTGSRGGLGHRSYRACGGTPRDGVRSADLTEGGSMRLYIRLSIAAAIVLMPSSLSATQANANNDPHREFLPAGPVDLPAGFCDFPTHYDVVSNKEYGTFTTLADGTLRLKETGSFKIR